LTGLPATTPEPETGSILTGELEAGLEWAQSQVEKYWDTRPAGEPSSCAHPGCDYRRYPASPFCLYHAKGNATFVARLRRSAEEHEARRHAARSRRSRERNQHP
jgi:hypothetical protein